MTVVYAVTIALMFSEVASHICCSSSCGYVLVTVVYAVTIALMFSEVASHTDKPSSGASGTSATLLNLSARPDTKNSLEKSAIQCVRDTTLRQILQDLDSVVTMLQHKHFPSNPTSLIVKFLCA